MDCILCESKIIPDPISGWGEGHNAEPLAAGRCCDSCNNDVVGERIRRFYINHTNNREITHATN